MNAKLAIFASGNGSNAVSIITHFQQKGKDVVAFVLSNKEDAPALKKAKDLGVATIKCSNKEANDAGYLLQVCKQRKVNYIVLAGYLRKVPQGLIQQFPKKIINIHPSLLPKYGGKGMYGMRVHEAVIANGEEESGITIHYVNEEFDQGEVIAQFQCGVEKNDSPATLAKKIKKLEQQYFAQEIEKIIRYD